MAEGNSPAPLGERKVYTGTLEPDFTLASWGSIQAEVRGNIAIITGVGIKATNQVTSGKLCTFSGLTNARYSVATGYVDGTSDNLFLVTMSASGDANSIQFENLKNYNANMYFQMITYIR